MQIMNVYECNGKNIFMRGKIDCFIQRGNSRTFSIALLENGTFYLISHDHNQPIKRPEFNEVLYNINC